MSFPQEYPSRLSGMWIFIKISAPNARQILAHSETGKMRKNSNFKFNDVILGDDYFHIVWRSWHQRARIHKLATIFIRFLSLHIDMQSPLLHWIFLHAITLRHSIFPLSVSVTRSQDPVRFNCRALWQNYVPFIRSTFFVSITLKRYANSFIHSVCGQHVTTASFLFLL